MNKNQAVNRLTQIRSLQRRLGSVFGQDVSTISAALRSVANERDPRRLQILAEWRQRLGIGPAGRGP